MKITDKLLHKLIENLKTINVIGKLENKYEPYGYVSSSKVESGELTYGMMVKVDNEGVKDLEIEVYSDDFWDAAELTKEQKDYLEEELITEYMEELWGDIKANEEHKDPMGSRGLRWSDFI